jgi:hypothetical protein
VANPWSADGVHFFSGVSWPDYAKKETWMNDTEYEFAQRRFHKRLPTAYDVLAVIQKSDPGTIREFVSDFGYEKSGDPVGVLETYQAVQDEYRKVTRFFSAEEIDELQEIQ